MCTQKKYRNVIITILCLFLNVRRGRKIHKFSYKCTTKSLCLFSLFETYYNMKQCGCFECTQLRSLFSLVNYFNAFYICEVKSL